MGSDKVRVAIIDLYNNEENQEIRCFKDILNETSRLYNSSPIDYKLFDTRYSGNIPDISFDIYISSGGPGSPWDGEGTNWEAKYFSLMDSLWSYNKNNYFKKYVFFICHSFQIMTRYFGLGDVIKRNSESFGVVPIHKTENGKHDGLIKDLPEPFYAADYRKWQVINPNHKAFEELGAQILCLENESHHVNSERAMMAIRVNDEFIGTQFHPESDAASMSYYFSKPERKEDVVSKYGEKKYFEMLDMLKQPMGITLTRKTVLPNFLKHTIKKLRPDLT